MLMPVKLQAQWLNAVAWLQMVASVAFAPVDVIKERLQARTQK